MAYLVYLLLSSQVMQSYQDTVSHLAGCYFIATIRLFMPFSRIIERSPHRLSNITIRIRCISDLLASFRTYQLVRLHYLISSFFNVVEPHVLKTHEACKPVYEVALNLRVTLSAHD